MVALLCALFFLVGVSSGFILCIKMLWLPQIEKTRKAREEGLKALNDMLDLVTQMAEGKELSGSIISPIQISKKN